MIDFASRENSGQRSRSLWFLLVGCLLITLIGLVLKLRNDVPNARPGSADVPRRSAAATGAHASRAPAAGSDRLSHGRSNIEPARAAEEIVAGKLVQFARSRREIVRGLARRFQVHVPEEVERFFDATEAGRWDEIETAFKALRAGDYDGAPRLEALNRIWPAILETYGTAEQAHAWPAQKLLDYGEAVLGSLRPGMVYVGGTDPGRFIPTLLNETSQGR